MLREHSLFLFLILSIIVPTINSQKYPYSSLAVDRPLPQFDRNWKVISVNNIPVHFDASVSESKIEYKYCNQKVWIYFSSNDGSFKAIQQKIPIMMNCTNMRPTEKQVDQAFKSISSYKIVNSQLHFYNSNKQQILVFESKNFSPQVSPIAKRWTALLVANISVNILVDITDDFIQFTYQNEITMPYRWDKNKIEIALGWPGKLTSSGTLYPSQSQVLTAFTKAKSYLVSNKNLVFLDEYNNVLVKMQPGNYSTYTQNIPSLDGTWQSSSVNGSNLYFRMNISNNIIQYVYSTRKTMQYSINSNIIHLSTPQHLDPSFKHATPNYWQTIIDDIFATVTNYRLQTNQLNFLNKDGTIVMIFTRPNPHSLIRNKGVLKPN